MNVLIWGDLSWCADEVVVGAAPSGRVVVTGQKSAEAVVPAGIVSAGKG